MNAFARGPLGPVDAVVRFLALCGRDADRAAVRAVVRDDATLAGFARAVAASGETARVVRLAEADVRALALPTLVSLKDGGVAILIAVERRALKLDFGDGVEMRVPRRMARDLLAGDALERATMDDEPQTTFRAVARLFATDGTLRRAAIQAAALGLLVHASSLVGPLAVLAAFDQAIPSGARGFLLVVVLAVIAAHVQQAVLAALRDLGETAVLTRLEAGLSLAVFARGLARPYAELAREAPGTLHRRLGSARELGAGALARLVDPMLRAVSLAAHAAVLIVTVPAVVPWVGVLATVLVCVSALMAIRIARRLRTTNEAAERQYHAMYELVAGVQTVRAARAEKPLAERWLTRLRAELDAAMRGESLAALHRHAWSAADGLLVGGVIVWGGAACLSGTVSIGAVLASAQSCVAIGAAIRALADVPVALLTVRVHAKGIEETLGATLAPTRDLAPIAPPLGEPAVVIDDLWYRHEADGPWLFRGLNLQFSGGESARLSWPSGAGKTTLLRLIAGLASPERGTIHVAGVDPRRARNAICYLPQATVFFAGSILDNLRLLSGDAPLDRILRACEATGLDDVVLTWPMQLETVLVHGGANLSSGQRQLVALTAAVASERPVLLLDEATANLDRITQERLRQAGVLEGRTVISVVHDVEEVGS